ncbi:MAG: NUDIX hydrolase, partial [Acidimicrobiales bacterium]
RPGDPPPWAALEEPQRRPTVDRVRRALALGPAPARSAMEGVSRFASAVLAPLYEHDGELWLVLTRRSWHLRAHKGEIAFPGGRQDPGETLWETALREAWEEVDLDRSAVEHLGELDHLATVTSRSFIVPHVGLLPARPELTANEDEVDGILHVPLSELLDPAIYRQERWGFGGLDREIHFFELEGDTLWGATASVLVDLLTRITAGD